jgi:hypothetical protein
MNDDFQKWRKGVVEGLNGVLQGFQRDLVATQVRVNLAWNGMNAVIRALTNKGLITQEDIQKAGSELMAEAKANVERARVAAPEKPTGITRVPLEVIRDDINAAKAEKE